MNYRNLEKLKLILMAIRENSEANGRLVNMAWQELGKPVKPTVNRDSNTKVSRGDNAVVRVLALRHYPISINTIVRETGLKPKSVHQTIWRLRSYGYDIKTSYDRSRKAKYRLIVAA
jgi:biotin operon repressor